MRIFYDTEFIEDGRTVDLISIGMVADDDRELYLIDEAIELEPLYGQICRHRWLMENVVPHLPLRVDRNERKSLGQHQSGTWYFNLDGKDNRVVSRRYIRNAVREFIAATPEPELWAWYGAYDHVAYAQLFGRMIDLPPGFPMWTNDLKQEVVRRGNPTLPAQASDEHHALADARQVRLWWRALEAGEVGDAG